MNAQIIVKEGLTVKENFLERKTKGLTIRLDYSL
jgi:hypothetical protein